MTRNKATPSSVDFGRLAGYVGYQVRQAQAAVFRDFASITADTGLTPGEFSLLSMVAANPGISQTSLARIHQLDKSTLSNSVNDLDRRGLVRRSRSPTDQRLNALHLTPAGETALDRAGDGVARQERAMEAVLEPGERERLLDMLKRIARAFD